MQQDLPKIAKLIRYYILTMTTRAGSGHPTSSLSATDLMTGLFFGGFFRFDARRPNYQNNDRLIFSKGHASPLFYALWAVSGAPHPLKKGEGLKQKLLTYRKFKSPLEGHPTTVFPYTEAATGSLGQGLSVGVGLAINAKYIERLPYRTFVLLGDSEMSEGAVWEAMQLAAFYKLNNLIGILDVNRFGQRGVTMYGHDLKVYQQRAQAFGWRTIVVKDGHNLKSIIRAFKLATSPSFPSPRPNAAGGQAGGGRDEGRGRKPVMIIAKTRKGKGVPYFEDKHGWHGKPLSPEEYDKVMKSFGEVDKRVIGRLEKPEPVKAPNHKSQIPNQTQNPNYKLGEKIATRKAYGRALVRIFPKFPHLVVLDAEVSNSTYSEDFKKVYPERFFEMYIAEQNMVGTALGLSARGQLPFVSSFAAFLTRAFDQIRMSQYSPHPWNKGAGANIKFVGSHAGVSIGEDGPSQMGLEDLAMFRSVLNSVVLYPADAVATDRLVEQAASRRGLVYIRTTRKDTAVIYKPTEKFPIGGSKVLRESSEDKATVVAAGITLHEALAAYGALLQQGVKIRVIDAYSIKPLDIRTLKKAARQTRIIITVEDHYPAGGIGEAISSALKSEDVKIINLAVGKKPMSGKPQELLDYEGISAKAIIQTVKRHAAK